jgi:hypothetical protein
VPVAVGKLSYSLYVWHMLVLFVVLAELQRRPILVGSALFVGASLVLAAVSYLLVERPLRAHGHARPATEATGATAAPSVPSATPGARPARARPAWALAGGGVAALVVLVAVPAYAARSDIVARDEAVAAAIAQQQAAAEAAAAPGAPPATPSTTPADAPSTTLPAVVLTMEPPAPVEAPPTGEAGAVVVAATMVDALGEPLGGRAVRFDHGEASCEATTDDQGRATCTVTPDPGTAPAPAGPALDEPVTATFAGDPLTPPATAGWP